MESVSGYDEHTHLNLQQNTKQTNINQKNLAQHNVENEIASSSGRSAAYISSIKEDASNRARDPPQELEAETLMGEEHRHVLAKLKFVLELIDALITMAEDKTNPIAILMESRKSVIFKLNF